MHVRFTNTTGYVVNEYLGKYRTNCSVGAELGAVWLKVYAGK